MKSKDDSMYLSQYNYWSLYNTVGKEREREIQRMDYPSFLLQRRQIGRPELYENCSLIYCEHKRILGHLHPPTESFKELEWCMKASFIIKWNVYMKCFHRFVYITLVSTNSCLSRRVLFSDMALLYYEHSLENKKTASFCFMNSLFKLKQERKSVDGFSLFSC